MKKKIMLINSSLLMNKIFEKALEEEGFEVFSVYKEPYYHQKNILIRIINKLIKIFDIKTNFIHKNYRKKYDEEIFQRIKKDKNHYDYTLFFHAQFFKEKLIKECIKKSDQMVSYQYDGWYLCQKIKKYQFFFDRLFFFDKNSINAFGEGALPLTNCWFPDNNDNNDNNEMFDFFYIGSGNSDREIFLNNLYSHVQNRYSCEFRLLGSPSSGKPNIIKYSPSELSYQENITLTKKAKVIIDIKISLHNGLSFRFFEALYYKKKIITNNHTVKHYDFYHPDNIFITDFQNFDGLEEFMQKPYFEIDQKIVDKYGFKNWIRYVLDTPPYQKIDIH